MNTKIVLSRRKIMEYKFITYTKEASFLTPEEENIALITLNRPDVMNALNTDILQEIDSALEEIRKDEKIKAVVITGSGRAFSAGADLSESPSDEAGMRKRIEVGQKVYDKIEDFEKPVIAAINGFAIAGGLEMCLACDIRIASENAQLGLVETNVGLLPAWGGVMRLPRLIGKGRAGEMVLTATRIDAKEAERIGLINKVVTPDELKSTAMWTAGTVATKAPIPIKLAKKIMARAVELSREEGNKMMVDGAVACMTSEDIIEGVSAMFEKRTPKFKGK
jgi:enoyl-CoA hydratase/carnithine racemase